MKEKRPYTWEALKPYEKILATIGVILGTICFLGLLFSSASSSSEVVSTQPYLALGCVIGLLLFFVGMKPWERW